MDIVVEKLRTRFVNTWEGKGSDQVHLKAIIEGKLLPLEDPLVGNGAVAINDMTMDIDVGVEDQAQAHPIQTSSNSSILASSPTSIITSPLSPSNPYSASLRARRQPTLKQTSGTQQMESELSVSIVSVPSSAAPQPPFPLNMESGKSQSSNDNAAADNSSTIAAGASNSSVNGSQRLPSRNPRSRVEQNRGVENFATPGMSVEINLDPNQGLKQLPLDPYPYLTDAEKKDRLEHLKRERERKLQQGNLEIDALNTTLEGVSIGQKINTEPRFEHGQNPSGSFLSSIVGKLNKGTEWLVGQQVQANTQDLPVSGQHNFGDGTGSPIQTQNQNRESPGAFMHGGLAVPSQQIDHTSQNYQQRDSRSFMNGGLASSVFAPTPLQKGKYPSQVQTSQTPNYQAQHAQNLMNNGLDTQSQCQQYSRPTFPESQDLRPETTSTLPNRQEYRSPFTVNEYGTDTSQQYPQVSQYPYTTVQQPATNQRRVHFVNTQSQEREAPAPKPAPTQNPIQIPIPSNAHRQPFAEQQTPSHRQYLAQHSSSNHSTPAPMQTHEVLGNRVMLEDPRALEDDDSTTVFHYPIPSIQPQQQQQQSQSVYGMNTNMYPHQESYHIPEGQNIPQPHPAARTPAQYPPYQHQSHPYGAAHSIIAKPDYNGNHAFPIFPGPRHGYSQSPYYPSAAAQHALAAPIVTPNHYVLPCPSTPASPTTPTPQCSRDFTSFLHDTKKTYKKESLKDKAKIEAYQRAMLKKERARKINILVGMANEVKEDGDLNGGDNIWGI